VGRYRVEDLVFGARFNHADTIVGVVTAGFDDDTLEIVVRRVYERDAGTARSVARRE
jgi:hypothetical protein